MLIEGEIKVRKSFHFRLLIYHFARNAMEDLIGRLSLIIEDNKN